MKIIPKLHPLTGPAAARDAKLRKASAQMEGAFVEQMYKSMRETVPEDGMFSGGAGEEMFSGLLDEHVAADTPTKWQHGLSESIYRQMRDAVQQQSERMAPAPETGSVSHAPVPPLAPDQRIVK